jgi:hypothetical protein
MAQLAVFEGARRRNRGHFQVDAPIEVVFPLFGAEAEANWAPGWRPEWIYPDHARALASPPERGWVFRTDGDTPEERIWYVEAYSEATHEATYLVLWPKMMAYRVEVKSRARDGGTFTTVEYDFCGLSPEGNRLVERRTANPDDFGEEMKQWAEQIERYLRSASRGR